MNESTLQKLNRAWAHLGQIAAVVTIIVGAAQLYNNYFPASSTIEAVGTMGAVDIKALPIYKHITSELQKANGKRSNISKSNELAASKFYYLSLVIKNKGTLEANDVVLKFPNGRLATVAAIEVNNQPTQVATTSNEIRIGDIKPNITTEVFIWGSYGLILDAGDIVVAHRNGATKIELTRPVHGGVLGIIDLLDPVLIGLILSLILLIAGHAYYTRREQKEHALLSVEGEGPRA
jgi:uncharacterized iron-regulated membrane protein